MKKYLIALALLAAFFVTGCTDDPEKPGNSGSSSKTQSSSSSAVSVTNSEESSVIQEASEPIPEVSSVI